MPESSRIFPGVTTTQNGTWRKSLEEADELGIKEICLFLTCLLIAAERGEFYKVLKNTKISKVPMVHLRSDMQPWELNFFIENFDTQAFNIHSEKEFPLVYDLGNYKKLIYLENALVKIEFSEFAQWAGICLDFTHLEDDRRLNPSHYQSVMEIISKFPCGCAHISSIKPKTYEYAPGKYSYTNGAHHFDCLSEFDYLTNYLEYFPRIIALELENPITEQLKAIEYIKKISAGKI